MTWEVLCGASEVVLPDLPDGSFDALVTDPPAGISFKEAAWDSFTRADFVASMTPIFAQSLRCLKPGAHGLVWALPRTAHWTAWALEDAGFEIRDVVHSIFGVGYPKSLNVSKAIDKRRDDRAQILEVTRAIAAARDAAGLTNREIDARFGFNGMAGHWTTRGEQPAIPTAEQWAQLRDLMPELAHLDLEIERLNGRKGTPGAAWFDREVIGQHPGPASSIFGDPKPATVMLTASATDEARRWEGWGSALKPSAEDWILVRKPLEGTIAENVSRYGVGALHIDAARIGPGRWPSNLTLSHLEGCRSLGSQQIRTGTGSPALHRPEDGASLWPKLAPGAVGYARDGVEEVQAWECQEGCAVRDLERSSGTGVSRFFYTVKPSTEERLAGLDSADPQHPTVKSVDLMRWLLRLITPPGGRVLDCFAGSGTTGCAAVVEGLGFMGIERDIGFADVARRRIEFWARHRERTLEVYRSASAREAAEQAGQLTLFGGA